MKTLVVYDSIYGNTAKIAQAIGTALGGESGIRAVGAVKPSDLEGLGLLVVGSPTNGGRPTPAIQSLLAGMAAPLFKDLPVAAFDTRLTQKWVGIFGYAAGRIAKSLKSGGARLLLPPEAFFVTGKEGPLKKGELERAAEWAKMLIKAL
jgi:flavodoxin